MAEHGNEIGVRPVADTPRRRDMNDMKIAWRLGLL
jgi:hypothetical protein